MGTKGVIMMSLGSNLKTIRLFRNKTLKELGQILGFSTSSADVRISQYESDKKKPRENVIENLAYKLDVSPQAIDIPDIETYIGAIYTLFQLERSYGLKIDELVVNLFCDLTSYYLMNKILCTNTCKIG